MNKIQIPLLRGFSESEKSEVLKYFSTRQFNPNDSIVEKGAQPTEMFILLQGDAEVRITGRLSIPVKAGDSIGEIGFVDQQPRSATVFAKEHVHVAVLSRDEYMRLGREHPHWANRLITNVLKILAAKVREKDEKTRREDRTARTKTPPPEPQAPKVSLMQFLRSKL